VREEPHERPSERAVLPKGFGSVRRVGARLGGRLPVDAVFHVVELSATFFAPRRVAPPASAASPVREQR